MLALITENQLDEWVRANAQDAQGVIVELIWRLVSVSCPRPRERRFPLGDSIGQHGPDGILETSVGFEPFVPEGRSFWQIGTGLRARDKATSDYKNLTEAIPEDTRRESSFVFVTPLSGRRDWEYTWKPDAQAKWVEERQARGEWKDVRIIDGTKLIDWLHHFPAVELWLTKRIIRLPTHQLETPEQRWKEIQAIGDPPLSPEIFLLNREEACEKLKALFSGKLNHLKLETHFPDEVVDFVAAYLASLDDESRAETIGRCLIVRGVEAWEAVAAQYKHHILVADPCLDLNSDEGARLIHKAQQAGHRVIMAVPRGGVPDPSNSAPLPSPSVYQLQKILQKAGYSEERARILARKSGGSLGSLLKLLQGIVLTPAWTKEHGAPDLALAMLIGSWDEKHEADRKAVEMVTGEPYDQWITRVREIALRLGVPLIQRDGKWKFISRYEAWYALGPRVFDDHLDRLRNAAVLVLQEKDPQFELPKEKRYAASIYGKVLAHSSLLRKGLAETLALLGSHPKALTSCSQGKAETIAILAVRDLLADADWTRWASLNDVLPLLAEAAPREFLNAVEKALNSDPCPFDEVFAQEGDGIFGRNYMTGWLWAMETLAWDPDHLSRVIVCLGELAARDPGGQWANRPMNSLTTILLPWLPQTCAPVAKRVAAVRTLLNELPEVGWELLLNLLPRAHSASAGSRRPAWRETIPADWSDKVTVREYWEQVELYSEMVIAAANSDYRRLLELVDHLDSIPPSAQEKLLALLGSDEILALPESERMHLWNKLVDLVTKHRKFADAQWAMPPDRVSQIESVANRIAPKDPYFQYQRLFSERAFDLFEDKRSYEEQWKELENRRQRAVKEIEDSGGVWAVLDFAVGVESPWKVGFAFGAVAGTEADEAILPQLLESEQKPLEQFAAGYVKGRFHKYGWNWVDDIDTSRWTPMQIALFLYFLPFMQNTWERAKHLLGNDESLYWTKVHVNPYDTAVGLETAVDQLIKYGGPLAAIRCIAKMLHAEQPFDTGQAIRALLAAPRSKEENSINVYEICEIIKALQNDPSTNPDDLFRVEWAYLPLLDEHYGVRPKVLERRLAEDPEFFCEVIRLVFRSKKEDSLEEETSEETRKIAENAYRLLAKWRTPPGSQEDGAFDRNAFNAWLNAVKKKCEETGHLEIAMKIVGQVLVYAPPDPDGLWIHRAVASALNAKDAEHMRTGFRIALFNSRGVHYVDPTGKWEREVAAKYRQQAEDAEMAGYHRLAATLRE